MTILFCGSTGEQITLTNKVTSSGEGTIWYTNKNGYLAKVYHPPDQERVEIGQERIEKLKVMVAYPPLDPNHHIPHISFAWPKSLLTDSNGWVLGFLMPEISDSKELLNIYNPLQRKRLGLEINWYFLHTVAQNIASIIQAIHAEGYVLGDIKPQNILVNNRALPSIIDTDSFQVRHPNNSQVYRCLVGSEGFTPVELLGQDLSTVEQSEVHDRFRLAVIIYLLLFGNPPFQGQWIGEGDSPEPTELVRRGFWPYSPNSLIKTSSRTIPLKVVHPEIQRCFLRCFNDGHTQPHLRPTAQEWKNALESARNQLIPCNLVDSHQYSQNYGKCYWCERASQIKFDAFPSQNKIITIPHSFVTTSTPQIFATDNLSELLQQEGKVITVKGKVVSTSDHANNHNFIINFGTITPSKDKGYFRLIVITENIQSLANFLNLEVKSLANLTNLELSITGKLKIHKKRKRSYPQIILEDPIFQKPIKYNTNISPPKTTSKTTLKSSIRKTTTSRKQKILQQKVKITHNLTQNFIAPELIKSSQEYDKKGRDCVKRGDYILAIKFYDLAIKLDMNNALFYRHRGNAYFYLKDYHKAIKNYQEALRLNPGEPKAAHNLTVAQGKLWNQQKTRKK